jgi:hypothetical protein
MTGRLRLMRFAALLAALALCACGSTSHRVVVHIRGSSATAPTATSCFLFIRQHILGGGTASYCLRSYSGRPGPNATLRDQGVMTFSLPHRTIRARVRIVAKFARDGRHARQRLHGTVLGGGSIVGGGPYVESPPGHVASADLRYVISLTA